MDGNNFYCSCEGVFQPGLVNKPLVVLSNNDGCVISRSDQAKAMGIVMGTPHFKLQHLEREKGLLVRSSNYTIYEEMSGRMMRIIGRHAPEREPYSIDECFLRFTGMERFDLYRIGCDIKRDVFQCIGIPVCVGLAETKVLAKMANRFAKKMRRKEGVYLADTEEKKMEMLEWCEVGDIWGVGHQYSLMLRKHGFRTAADLVKAPPDFVQEKMTVVGHRLLTELKGIPAIGWQEAEKPKKNICTSRSFGSLLYDKGIVTEAVATHAAACAEKLRKQDSICGVVHVFINTNPHRPDLPQYYHSINVKLPLAANDTPTVVKAAVRGLNLIWKDGYDFMKVGVIVQDLKPKDQVQLALFETKNGPKLDAAMAALDGLNKRFGKQTVQVATQGQEKAFRMRQDHLSRRFISRIEEVIEI